MVMLLNHACVWGAVDPSDGTLLYIENYIKRI